jgi:hypothetical protein
MPKREQGRRMPAWAERERTSDMAWLAENLYVLWPAAQAAYSEHGRGAVTVDTTVHPPGASGHPFWYMTQEQLIDLGDPDILRMVAEYDPSWELVATLLKVQERTSTYRVGVPEARQAAGPTQS